VKARADVEAFFTAALAAWGRDNGELAVRRCHENYYGAFVLDLDNFSIEAVCDAQS
jgi:hypothetical protein